MSIAPSPPADVKPRLTAEIDARSDDLIALTQDLIRIPTVNPPGENYREICDYLEARLALAKERGYVGALVWACRSADLHTRWDERVKAQVKRAAERT